MTDPRKTRLFRPNRPTAADLPAELRRAKPTIFAMFRQLSGARAHRPHPHPPAPRPAAEPARPWSDLFLEDHFEFRPHGA